MSSHNRTGQMSHPGRHLDFSDEGYKEILLRIAGAEVWLECQRMELAALAYEEHRQKSGQLLHWYELRELVRARFGLVIPDASLQTVSKGESRFQDRWRHEGLIGY